jgi:Asp-tRNA(Asn)/Glu-tRNA(Gln) amidotransferase A subunit family amidase
LLAGTKTGVSANSPLIFASRFPPRGRPPVPPIGGAKKIIFSRDLLGMRPEPTTAGLFEQFLERLESQGHVVIEAKIAAGF